MTMFKILGILAVLATGMIAIPDISAVRCSEDKNPIMSPSGKTACVFDDTFARLLERGWSMPTLDEQNIQTVGSVVPTTDTWNTRDLAIPSDPDAMGEYIVLNSLFPIYEVEIPKTTPINDIMNITIRYDYSPRYTFYDTENPSEFDPANSQNLISLRPTVNGEFIGPEVFFRHTKHLEMISDFPLVESAPPGTDYYGEGMYSYWITLPYNGNVPHTEQISFKVKKPMLYNQEEFHISMPSSESPQPTTWYSSTNDGRLTISPIPIYAEGADDEFPQKGIGKFNPPGYHKSEPGEGPISPDQIDSLAPEVQKAIREWIAKMNKTNNAP